MTRDELIIKYKGYCVNEYIKSIQELNLEEQIHFTDTLVRICYFILRNEDEYMIYELLEQELYIKYRSKMKYFVDSHFINHFIFENNGFEKFSKDLVIKDEALNTEEHNDLLLELYMLFDLLKTRLYVLDKDSKGFSKTDVSNELLINTPIPSNKFKAYNTRSQQVLLMYYLNLALEIKVRKEISIVNVAKFYNALFGWEYDDINNSGLYKHFKKDPLAKHNRKELYEHLHWVKDQFKLIGLTEIINLIDAKIQEVKKELF